MMLAQALWRQPGSSAILCEMTKPHSVLSFIGRVHHPGYEMPIWLQGADAAALAPDQLRLILVEQGCCRVAGQNYEAPVLMLIGPDGPDVALGEACATVVDFEPGVINGALSVRALAEPHTLTGTVSQDAYLLRAFFPPERVWALRIDPRTELVVRRSLDNIAREGEVQRDANWPCRTRSHLIELLFILRLALEQAGAGRRDDLFDRANAVIQQRLEEKLTVTELARLCGTNRSTLNEAFRMRVGSSVHAYVMRRRMELAATLLRDTGLPVSEVLRRVGYENASHFSRQFRAMLGVTPGAYRRAETGLRAAPELT
jgi:AraC-type DNA-binding domain-containing proteins